MSGALKKISLMRRAESAAVELFAGTRIGNALAAFSNRYEAANPWTPERSWIPSYVRDARHDANSWSRWEMCRKIRYFEENVWIIGALKQVFQKYTVGPFGLPVIPASSDTTWNAKMFAAYSKWCHAPCVDSRASMGAVHKMIAGEYHIDGEIFVLKTRPTKRAGVPSVPKIKLVESHRCSSPGQGFSADDDPNLIDGVGLDNDGQPVTFYLRDGLLGDEWVDYPAKDVIQVFEPHRPGMYRAVTGYAPVLNKTHDLDDLEVMEMGRAKQNAEVSYWLKTWNGELPPSMQRQERGIVGRAGGNPTGRGESEEGLQKRLLQYSTALGSKVKALKQGEEVQRHESASPTAAQQWYYRYLTSQICQARGIPVVLILPESMQGTVVRGVLDDANIYFRSQFHVLKPAVSDIYLYYAQWARFNVPGLEDAPADWDKHHVIPPRACNVDQGRNTTAMLAELAAGTANWDDIAGEDGTTGEIMLRKKAAGVQMIKRIAFEMNQDVPSELQITAAEISQPLGQVLQQLAIAEQANASAEMSRATTANQETNPEKETVNA